MHQSGENGQIVRGVCDGVAVEAQQVRRGLDGMPDQPTDDNSDRVEAVRERRRDAEVPTAAAKRPEEIGMARVVDVEDVALCRHQLDREQVVRGEAVLGHQPAEPTAERVARDTRPGHGPSGHCEPVLGGRLVQFSPEDAALDLGGRLIGIDHDPFHLGEVDHHTTVGHGAAGHVVAAAADRDLEPRSERESQRCNDVVGRPAADDERWSAVDEAVVHGSGLLVACVLGAEDGPGDPLFQVCDEGVVEGGGHLMLLSIGGADHRRGA